jgi:pimeloyl-ACP methyl ester carboxylesterase
MRKTKAITIVSILVLALIPTTIPMFQTSSAAVPYTVIFGSLSGANYTIRIPTPIENWNRNLVVFCHGYSHAEAVVTTLLGSSTTNYGIDSIIANGYAVAGSTYGAGGYCIQQGISNTYQLTQYVVNNYNVTGKVFLYGISMGGNIALLTGQKYPNTYSGVLDLSGTKDIADAYNTKLDFLSAKDDSEMTSKLQAINAFVPPYPFSLYPPPLSTQLLAWRAFLNSSATDIAVACSGTPQNASQAYANISPDANANISIPVITVHGTSDALVPFSQSLKYQTSVAAAGRSSLYRLYPVAGGQHVPDPLLVQQLIPKLLELKAWSDAINNTFSIMQISDTQHLAFLSPTLYNDTTSWIVNNSVSYNLQMVIHTGDFADAFATPPLTIYNNTQMAQEWAVANGAMVKLLNAGIPYCWCAGNHDQTPFANPNGTMIGSNLTAFNTTVMRSKPYWVDDIYDAKNTAVKFTYNNYPFMIIDLECFANSSALAWMKGLLDKNTGVNTIVATHGYLDINANYDASAAATGVWTKNLKATLDSYPNVFLAISGHNHGWNMTRAGNRQEILFDFQEENNKTGAAAVRVYTFNLANMQVYASTYCIDNKTWLLNPLNQFSFSASTLVPIATPALSASVFCSVTAITGQTWYFFAHSTGGLGSYSFQWYEGATLLPGQTSMILPMSKTAAGIYSYTCKVTDTQGTTATSNAITLTVISR